MQEIEVMRISVNTPVVETFRRHSSTWARPLSIYGHAVRSSFIWRLADMQTDLM